MNCHKTTFPLPRIKKPRARSGTLREIVAETFSGEKQTYFIEPFLVKMHTKLARIKNLKNLNIGTDRLMQTA